MSSTTVPQLLPAGGRPVVKARRPVPVQQLQLGIVLVVVSEVLVVVSTMLDVVVSLVDVEVVVTVSVVLVLLMVEVVVGHVQSSWHSRMMWPGPRAGQVRLQGGSHSSPGSMTPLPQSGVVVVVVLTTVVVVLNPTHGSGTQPPSPPVSMPDAAAHSLGFCGSQTNAPPAEEEVGRQQLMSWGVWRGVQPWSIASHKLAKELTQAVPPAGARHFAAGVMAHCVSPCEPVVQQIAFPARPQLERWAQRIAACIPCLESRPAESAFMVRPTQRRYPRCEEALAQSHCASASARVAAASSRSAGSIRGNAFPVQIPVAASRRTTTAAWDTRDRRLDMVTLRRGG